MEFFIETKELQKIVKQLGVTSKTNTTENPGRILIEVTEEKGVVFTSVNFTNSLVIKSEKSTIKEYGAVAILYSKLKLFVLSFNALNEESNEGVENFHFVLKKNNLFVKVKNKNSNGKISRGSLKFETFKTYTIPKPPEFEKSTFILNSDILKLAIDKVIYAINPNEARKNLKGMFLSIDEEFISFVGTDGLKLSEYTIKNNSNIEPASYIIQQEYISGLRHLISDNIQIFFEIRSGKIIVQVNNLEYTGSLIVGQEYPDYKAVLDKYTDSFTVNKKILLNNLRPFMNVLNTEDNNRLCIRINNKKINFYNESLEFVYDEEFDEEKELSIDVNGSFLMQSLNAMYDDSLLIKFSDSNGCLIMDSANFEDQKSLITPIALRD